MKLKFEKRVLELLYAIPDINQLTMSPAIFSDDIELHDCDKCENYNNNIDVCIDCWERAINNAYINDLEPDHDNYKLFGNICRME